MFALVEDQMEVSGNSLCVLNKSILQRAFVSLWGKSFVIF